MLAVATNVDLDRHDTGPGHPERPPRLRAALDGLVDAGLHDAIVPVRVEPAVRADLERVHDVGYLDQLQTFCAEGGGDLDPDTPVVAGSWDTALLAAGAGLATVAALEAGDADAGLVLVRPPGHHATASHAMGFCLFNNVAVTAAALAERGERVLVLDWDVHHGNGTQDIFWDDPRVLFVSTHLANHWPFTGQVRETGGIHAPGGTINLPFPHGVTGDVFLRALEDAIAPAVERFAPTWVLASAGYDGHRDDPLGGMGLTSGDFAQIARRVAAFAPSDGRFVMFLEGGYDLAALRHSVGASASAVLGGSYRPEGASNGGPGETVVRMARGAHLEATQWF